MNNPNPLLPQGSLQQAKGKSNVRIAVFTILAIHVVLLCGLLIQGCKPNPPQPTPEEQALTNTPPATFEPMTNAPDLNAVVPIATNAPAPAPIETVTPVQPVTPVVSAETKVHVVAKGESLSTIALKEHVSLKALEEANPGVDPLKLQIGQKLNIPAPATSDGATATETTATNGDATVYTVKSGDALEKIAKNFNTTVKAIKAANGLKTDRINAGQKLKIPAPEPAATNK